MNLIFFQNQAEFSDWLEEYHLTETELYVGFYKIKTGKPSLTWSQSVDVALCFGWIDGVKKSIDNESYMQRFTPRKASSNWSAINLKKVEELIAKGLMRPAGLAIYEKRRLDKSNMYSFENEPLQLSGDFNTLFKQHDLAWKFFEKQAPSYRKTMIHWIMSAKQQATRISRLEKLIAFSGKLERIF